MAAFQYDQPVMFRHCDPAKIVFYPRYFEMVNTVIETWFEREANYPFLTMFDDANTGVPTAAIETRFHAPSRMGEMLNWTLQVTRLGGTSVSFDIDAHCKDQKRVSVVTTLVHVDGQTGKPKSWPQAARDNIQNFMERT